MQEVIKSLFTHKLFSPATFSPLILSWEKVLFCCRFGSSNLIDSNMLLVCNARQHFITRGSKIMLRMFRTCCSSAMPGNILSPGEAKSCCECFGNKALEMKIFFFFNFRFSLIQEKMIENILEIVIILLNIILIYYDFE